jgi:hypothetical protein
MGIAAAALFACTPAAARQAPAAGDTHNLDLDGNEWALRGGLAAYF